MWSLSLSLPLSLLYSFSFLSSLKGFKFAIKATIWNRVSTQIQEEYVHKQKYKGNQRPILAFQQTIVPHPKLLNDIYARFSIVDQLTALQLPPLLTLIFRHRLSYVS